MHALKEIASRMKGGACHFEKSTDRYGNVTVSSVAASNADV